MAFSPEKLAYMQAHIDDSRVPEIHWVYSVPIVAAVISTSLRLWAKKAGRNGITLDDYLIIFATICLIGECASGLGYGPPYGMGRHVIAVAPHDLTMVRKGDYVFSHFYDIALVTVKLGILAFYYRIFVVPLFRKLVLVTAAFVLVWGIGITVALAVVCRPIEAYWDSNVVGKCLNLVTFTYFTNISNLVTDVWIFLMPIPVIWHLQLQLRKKLLLSFIFSIGLATCIVSSVRLTVVLGHGDPDFTWSYVPLGAYSVFEPLGGILCTNLPIIWHMWRKRRPILPGSSTFTSLPKPSTPTPGSGLGKSRRSRMARSLGLSGIDATGTDSQSRTILGKGEEEQEENRWAPTAPMDDIEALKGGRSLVPTQFWNKVERGHSNTSNEMTEASSSSGAIRIGSEVTVENAEKTNGLAKGRRSGSGMKKTTWQVRKK
ncbi:hypothetical protein K504DRAFT_500782 [Pleomassaria siparia CBS 279.74]|uniref:Rhodopsin domain-containing protein n=1 Tax=Pleomassaria siparia CBS 279.74 TaxID=1314801 RepID=A0A6G1KDB3_9PLEO|nr:hypothetical protein K504DRAFT_500782 [Pleomassaria siparia CBS 279.74]